MVIVTGHQGFIGRNLCERTRWQGVDLKSGWDVRDYDAVYDTLACSGYDEVGVDTCVHLAALTGVEQSLSQKEAYGQTNIDGTYNVAKACFETNTRLIFASSSSVYEARSPYAKTKQHGERIVEIFQRRGLDATILRLFTVFGEHNREDMAVARFIRSILAQTPIELYGNCRRDFTYVGDVCRAIETLVGMKGINGTFDLGFGHDVSVVGMLRAIEDVMGMSTTVMQKARRECDAYETKADPSLIRRLGVERTELKDAIERTIATL